MINTSAYQILTRLIFILFFSGEKIGSKVWEMWGVWDSDSDMYWAIQYLSVTGLHPSAHYYNYFSRSFFVTKHFTEINFSKSS